MSLVDWEEVTLGDACDVIRGSSPRPIKQYLTDDEDGVNWVKIGDTKNVEKYITATKQRITRKGSERSRPVSPGDLLLSNSMSYGKPYVMAIDGFVHDGWFVLRNFAETFDPDFFYILLTSNLVQDQFGTLAAGAVVKNISSDLVKKAVLPVPPLAEQKRIVSILDEAFSAIAKAKENAEKNLLSARELFESYLNRVFTQQGPGWKEKTLPDISENLDRQRKPITKSKREPGEIPYYGASGVVDHIKDFLFNEDLLLISEDGANLLARTYPIAFSISGKTWVNNHAHVLRFENFKTQRFIEFYLNSISLEPWVSGMAQPKLNQTKLNTIPVPSAPPKEQSKVVATMEILQAKVERLETIYNQKLANLDELKQSLLQKAFTGQLTNREHISRTALAAVPETLNSTKTGANAQTADGFPISIAGISTTDLHAGILALAYLKHEQPNTKHFGHVKGEKVAHLVENLIGIDLGRSPIKDAAGPNDFVHLKKVESRAKKARFFEVARQDDRYILSPKGEFQALVEKTKHRLGNRLDEVESLLEVMAKMTTRQAEIFATTFAAWNNLLILGKPCDDDSIVLEARENWHPNKLKIPREKFLKSITWMREKAFIPNGLGKLVAPKPKRANA